MRKMQFLALIIFLISPNVVSSWEGYDYENGSYIEIDKENLVRPGNDIEIYDYGTGEYKDVEVESINRFGSSAEIEVYDYSTGEHRIFDMDSR